ncbi:Eco57I restriction-modification methylase domain-containing protein [Chitinophaga sancti]|uniref:site-specific DNA-methyltransferase (adenine-specific) n=1 Tax=Chitinophaga sancti TaxID=1004 RepID=A0A1K1Q5B5_9BACT|nr:N-6 DNA methylase [Chitinophaga sancti]WQD61123.1 N-6 DNA methylase [Chitinophaga sancti]WQG86750.1 N-6 DNA methylase [Chitinophaga sancti]SFW54875.1 N-6 DNA Methylase [Chitinophaga sancti]
MGISENNVVSQLDLLVNEKLEKLPSLERKKILGQVFTPDILAGFMASIIKKELQPAHTILDPCIGPNSFFSHFEDPGFNPSLLGIEVDKTLITPAIEAFFKAPDRQLVIDSFLSYPLSNKFDFVIQNPPYVRQELLVKGINTKEIAAESIGAEIADQIPSQSNLYVYFLIKAILHLKDNGLMVAVIYDSWLYNSFGKALKSLLTSLGSVNNIYHFKKDAFPDAEVGATIIEFRKKRTNEPVNYYVRDSIQNMGSLKDFMNLHPVSIPQSDFATFNFNDSSSILFDNDLFALLGHISKQPIQRGISSIANVHFLHETKRFKEAIPVIKDITKLLTYGSNTHTAYLLALKDTASAATMQYLEQVKTQILETADDKLKGVKDKIRKGGNWFKINLKAPGNFIFNYYLRNNIDFIFNEDQLHASDNFYILSIPEEPLVHLAILNSSFTRISVLRKSRSQGGGLRKIQLYEFTEVPVMKIDALSKSAVAKLGKLGADLKGQNRYNGDDKEIISNIDKLLLAEYNRIADHNVTLEDLQAELKRYIN